MNAPPSRTTFEKVCSGFDVEHEHALADAIIAAIAEVSRVTDANVIAIRTGECASALLSVLATVLAMSPTATRSPTAIRKTVDELGNRLRRRVADAERDADLQSFIARHFRGLDVEGNA